MRMTFGLAALMLAGASGQSFAQSVIVTDPPPMERGAPPPMEPLDRPASTGSVNPTPPGCASTTTRHEAPDGSATTVRKERCNPD